MSSQYHLIEKVKAQQQYLDANEMILKATIQRLAETEKALAKTEEAIAKLRKLSEMNLEAQTTLEESTKYALGFIQEYSRMLEKKIAEQEEALAEHEKHHIKIVVAKDEAIWAQAEKILTQEEELNAQAEELRAQEEKIMVLERKNREQAEELRMLKEN